MAGRLSPLFFASACALFVFVGCSSDSEEHDRWQHRDDRCSGVSSCGECTPIVGCGWCSYPSGGGACVSEPDLCSGPEFRWDWEPSGCPGATPDASSDAPKSDASTDVATDARGEVSNEASSDTATDAPLETISNIPDTPTDVPADNAPACTVPSAGLGGCVPTTGGTLCTSSQFTLACHASGGSTPAPDASLHCSVATSASGATFYCCPCS